MGEVQRRVTLTYSYEVPPEVYPKLTASVVPGVVSVNNAYQFPPYFTAGRLQAFTRGGATSRPPLRKIFGISVFVQSLGDLAFFRGHFIRYFDPFEQHEIPGFPGEEQIEIAVAGYKVGHGVNIEPIQRRSANLNS